MGSKRLQQNVSNTYSLLRFKTDVIDAHGVRVPPTTHDGSHSGTIPFLTRYESSGGALQIRVGPHPAHQQVR